MIITAFENLSDKLAGVSVEDVNKLLRQYEQMRKMFRQMNSKGGKRNLMRGMRMPGGPKGFGF